MSVAPGQHLPGIGHRATSGRRTGLEHGVRVRAIAVTLPWLRREDADDLQAASSTARP